MKIEFHPNNVILTSGQQSLMEKKLSEVKRFLPDEPLTVDVYLQDASSPEKGGEDQVVRLVAIFGKEKIIIEEADAELMKAFAVALQRFERDLERFHERRLNKSHSPGGLRLEKIFGVFKVKRRK